MNPQDRRKIARIDQISGLARTSWIGLLAYLAFIFVTLLGVEDADFFVPSRQTQLPLVNVSIPTASFFIFAPVLAAALYVYLHLFLVKLWDAIADAPSEVRVDDVRPEWIPLSDAIHPWLANDLACAVKGNGAQVKRPLRRIGGFVTMLLVWVAGPAVIFAFWVRSMGAHNEWLTLAIATSLWLSVLAMLSSMLRATEKLRKRPIKAWRSAFFVLCMLFFTWTLAKESWLRTEGGFEHYAKVILPLWHGDDYEVLFLDCDPRTRQDCLDAYGMHWPESVIEERRISAIPWLPRSDPDYLMPTDLFEAEMVPLPDNWRDWDTARRAFREGWCRREGLSMQICGHRRLESGALPPHVATARAEYCGDHGVQADAACVSFFDEMDQRFDLEWETERESLRDALAALDLSGEDLRGVVGPRASFVNAVLFRARMEGADLREARMEGADLSGARMEGADLREADFRSAEWAGGETGAPAHSADLRGAVGLTQDQLDQLIGNSESLLPETLDDGSVPSIPSCWETPPPFYRAMLHGWIERGWMGPAVEFQLNARWLCQREGPARTGTPRALKESYPDGHPLEDRDDWLPP